MDPIELLDDRSSEREMEAFEELNEPETLDSDVFPFLQVVIYDIVSLNCIRSLVFAFGTLNTGLNFGISHVYAPQRSLLVRVTLIRPTLPQHGQHETPIPLIYIFHSLPSLLLTAARRSPRSHLPRPRRIPSPLLSRGGPHAPTTP